MEAPPCAKKKRSIGRNALWSKVNPRVQSGAPVLRGTRMPVNAIIDNFDYGVSLAEIAEQFELAQASVEAVLAYGEPPSCASCLTRTFRSACGASSEGMNAGRWSK